MKIISTILLALSITFTRAHAVEVPVKAKALLTIAAYGTAGGALLGAASMAFGTNSRAIPQGASLGLYAGILFGAYVLISHHNKRMGDYDDGSSPYKDSNSIYGDEYNSEDGGSSDGEGDSGSFFNRLEASSQKFSQKKGGMPPFKINVLSLEF